MTLGSTQPLTEMGTRNLPGGKGRPARKADNLTSICEPPQPVTKIALPTHIHEHRVFVRCNASINPLSQRTVC
jgi:hypothetical protein